HEDNVGKIFLTSLGEHPFVLIWFVVLMTLWTFLYKKVKIAQKAPKKLVPYFLFSILTLCVAALFVVGGIRGDFRHSTRPINLVDANRHVEKPVQANLVLNSVFSFFRTITTNNFKEVHFVDEKFIEENIKPYKFYPRENVEPKPNVVI